MPKAFKAASIPGTGKGKQIGLKGAPLTGSSLAKQAQVKQTQVKLAKQAQVKPVRPVMVGKPQVEAVLQAADKSGLLREKSSRIGGRISPALIKQAKKQTGIATDTDLIEFALANVALEDNFAEVFKKSRGKVDPALKLGF